MEEAYLLKHFLSALNEVVRTCASVNNSEEVLESQAFVQHLFEKPLVPHPLFSKCVTSFLFAEAY